MFSALSLLGWNLLLSTVFAGLLWILSRGPWLRDRPSLLHVLWALVLLKMITPPLIPVPLIPALTVTDARWSAPEGEPGAGGSEKLKHLLPTVAARADPRAFSAGKPHSAGRRTERLIAGVLLASLLVTLWLWLRIVQQSRRLVRLLRIQSAPPARVSSLVSELSHRFGLRSPPGVLIVSANVSIMLWTQRRCATIVLPRSLVEPVDEEQLRYAVAHELAHLVRRDYWTSTFAFLVASLFWWNPIAWLARRELLLAAECCCDAIAMERTAASRPRYARALLTTIDSLSNNSDAPPLLAAQFCESHSLVRRIEMIANSRTKSTLAMRTRFLVFSMGLIALSLLPVHAQQATNERQKSDARDQPNVVEKQVDEAKSDALLRAGKISTSSMNQPTIKSAKLIAWAAEDESLRAYFFRSQDAADSFARVVQTFNIAIKMDNVISELEPAVLDMDRKRHVTSPPHARQLKLDAENVVLLFGKRNDHARIEQLARALGIE